MVEQDTVLEQISSTYGARGGWLRKVGIAFLIVQSTGVLLWWALMLLFPAARTSFLAPGAPDTTLFAFFLADLLLYAGGSFLAAYGLARDRRWAWPVLCAHAGAAVYATLYGLALPLFSGGGWLGAVLMAPSLLFLPVLVWQLRPESLS
jgi:hypothetical protein